MVVTCGALAFASALRTSANIFVIAAFSDACSDAVNIGLLAVDDVADSFSPSCANLYLTDKNTGLTDVDVAKIIEGFKCTN